MLEATVANATATIERLTTQKQAPAEAAEAAGEPEVVDEAAAPEPQHAAGDDGLTTPASGGPLALPLYSDEDNIISRLCGRQWMLNSDEEGQYKYFGPTSSLHLTESVSSSLLQPGSAASAAMMGFPEDNNTAALQRLIDADTHAHLLDTYWRYQHTVLQVFDREEFLAGLEDARREGSNKHYSRALLCTVYACAARISDRPHLRALVVPSPDDLSAGSPLSDTLSDSAPYLVGLAARLVDQELQQRPRITTIQALLLLSVIYCSLSKDTKGWIATGIACSLAIDFGLHKSDCDLASAKLSSRDLKARRITYWGCLVFDRYVLSPLFPVCFFWSSPANLQILGSLSRPPRQPAPRRL